MGGSIVVGFEELVNTAFSSWSPPLSLRFYFGIAIILFKTVNIIFIMTVNIGESVNDSSPFARD